MANSTYFFKDRPLFGLDIGFSSTKVMQLNKQTSSSFAVQGYGIAEHPESAVKQGVIVDFDAIAASIKNMFESSLTGTITTRRVAFSVPASHTFSRIITLPSDIEKKDLNDAILTETAQYIPTPLEELYTDYVIIERTNKETRVLTVAIPRKITDSYMRLAEILGLEVIAIETTTGASNRLFGYTDQHKVPTVLIDFGSIATDITIYDKNLVVTGTVNGGGDHYTQAIAKELDVTKEEAQLIKTRYGVSLSKRQSEILKAIQPFTDNLSKEIRRMIRYYEERANDNNKRIGQVVTLGGGANIPGLSDHLTELLRLPVRSCDPWHNLLFTNIKQPTLTEKSLFLTVAGLALINPRELFE